MTTLQKVLGDREWDYIELGGRDHLLTAVDREDTGWLKQHHWYRVSNGYAGRKVQKKHQVQTIWMHRAILERHGLLVPDMEVDHTNRDPLDNRKQNLRCVSHARNRQNTGACRGSTSKYRGVSYSRTRGRWLAQAQLNGVRIFLGRFGQEQDAAATVRQFWTNQGLAQ